MTRTRAASSRRQSPPAGSGAAAACRLHVAGAAALWLTVSASTLAALEVPPLAGRVNDLAGLLDADEQSALDAQLATLESETGAQVALLMVPSLEGDSLEDFSIRVADAWKLGREGVDDGALLLIARDERQLRLEVGYGLEGAIPDATARRIIDDLIVPHLQQGDFAGGIGSGVEAVASLVRGEGLPAPPKEPAGEVAARWLGRLRDAASGCSTPIFIIALVIFFSYLERRYPKVFAKITSSGGSSWSSRSSGGSSYSSSRSSSSSSSRSFSGGGGSFGGGGASGRW